MTYRIYDAIIVVVILEMNLFELSFFLLLFCLLLLHVFIIEYEKCHSFPFFSVYSFTPYIMFILLKDQNSVSSQVHLLLNCFFGFLTV
jgi:hypothetical protein